MRQATVTIILVLGVLLMGLDIVSLQRNARARDQGMKPTPDTMMQRSTTPTDPAQAGEIALQAKQFQSAVDLFTRALENETDPSRQASLLISRGDAHVALGQSEAALEDYDASLTIEPDQPLRLIRRALLYRVHDQPEKALADLDHVLEIDPTNINAHYARGAVLYGLEKFAEAEQTFSDCIALDPSLATAYFNRAHARMRMGSREKACADLEKFISLSNDASATQQARDLLKTWKSETP